MALRVLAVMTGDVPVKQKVQRLLVSIRNGRYSFKTQPNQRLAS
jgi:hypothetical protein